MIEDVPDGTGLVLAAYLQCAIHQVFPDVAAFQDLRPRQIQSCRTGVHQVAPLVLGCLASGLIELQMMLLDSLPIHCAKGKPMPI